MPEQPSPADLAPPNPDFYVGYLPTPPRHLRFVRRLAWITLAWIIALGTTIAATQRDPGPAVWDTGTERDWTGTLLTDPYPMLLPDDGTDPLLIVEMAKHGAHPRLEPHDGQRLTVRGYLLERDARRMIELIPGDAAITVVGPAVAPTPSDAVPVPVTLLGEIVDGKCYVGAMKPGDGIAHKSCATLCIRGGLPPMFLTTEDARPVFRLLVVDGSTTLSESLLALVAEPVRITGELTTLHGLPIIRTTAAQITRR